MALESYQVHTISCDIPGCKEKKTSGSVENLRGEGWFYLEIFNTNFEICPEHAMDLREFFINPSQGSH